MNPLIREIENANLRENAENLQVGDTVKVHAMIKEGNKERIQIFEGVVLKKQNAGVRETITVRKISNGVGVERTWPLHSPTIDHIEVTRRSKVRRAKLYFLRDRVGKAARLKERIEKKK